MRLSAWQFIFYVTLVFACGYANAGSIAKRDDGDSALLRYIDIFEKALRNIPVVGEDSANAIDWMVQAISLFEVATNGALGRLLGGAFPCTITLNGTSCTGLTNNGGFGKLTMDVINGVPSLILPGFAKSLIGLLIQMFVDPTVDVLFGGVVVNN